jgi:hypothetical protein
MIPGVLQSHTATEQWQSFEIRMRRRRVERCLLRASVAIEAGVLDDARAALDEVQRLDPYEPELATLRAQLAAADAMPPAADLIAPSIADSLVLDSSAAEPPLPHEAPERGSAWRYAAAALLVAMSGVGGWWVSSSTAPSASSVQAAPSPRTSAGTRAGHDVSRERPRVSESAATAATAAEPTGGGTTPIATAGSPAPTPGPAAAAAEEPPDTAVATPDPQPAASVVPGIVTTATSALTLTPATITESPRPVAALLEPAPALAEPAPAAPVAVAGTDGVALSDTAVNLTSAAALPTVPVAPPPAAASQLAERMVRGTLSRYESAYSSLDAAAAHAVWPGVDHRALSNAFQGLSSQTVSLGQCDVRLNGATAQAECRGTARWTPKVGGPQTAARHWRFDLRNTGTDWVITGATVR